MRFLALPLVLVSVPVLLAAACGGSGNGSGFPDGTSGASGGSSGASGGSSGASSGSLFGDGGSSGSSGASSSGGPCSGIQCNIHQCAGGKHTTLSGQVFDPAGQNPLYNVVVYVPNGTPKPFTDHATCDKCDALYTGNPIAAALTGADGKFTIKDVPDGTNVPVVIQVGKWRKQVVLPTVTQCADTPLPKAMTTLPSKHGPNNDMPKIAVSTGGADSIECLLRRIGIDDSEFAPGGTDNQRVHLFQGLDDSGGQRAPAFDGGMPSSYSNLLTSTTQLLNYDILILSCEGDENGGSKDNLIKGLTDYADQGGRVFASHFHYYWFNTSPVWNPTASWTPGSNDIGEINGAINTTFQKGIDFKAWLGNVGALNNGLLNIKAARHNADVNAANPMSQPWITVNGGGDATEYFTFNTPIGKAADQQCGRAVYSDLHVGAASNDYGGGGGTTAGGKFPSGCTNGPLQPQEKALEFMLFDLSSCVTPDNQPPAPPPIPVVK